MSTILEELPNDQKIPDWRYDSKKNNIERDLGSVIDVLNMNKWDLSAIISKSFNKQIKNSLETFSLRYFYIEINNLGFKDLEPLIEKKLLHKMGFEKVEIKHNTWTASQLYQLFGSKGNHSILLVHPMCGVIEPGKTDVKELNLENNPEYIKLMTQAKFYMGVLNQYNTKERDYLTSWIQEKGANEMEAFLLNNILSVRDKERREYPKSALKKLINTIRQRK